MYFASPGSRPHCLISSSPRMSSNAKRLWPHTGQPSGSVPRLIVKRGARESSFMQARRDASSDPADYFRGGDGVVPAAAVDDAAADAAASALIRSMTSGFTLSVG